MDKYIGTKLIEAEPANRIDGKVFSAYDCCPTGAVVEPGYRVRYADGYESWSPKDVFERAYLNMTVNSHLKTDKPSISQKMVDDFIVAAEVTTMGDKCTVVRAVLRNGFEIVESSACVSAENYDEKLGADICMERIKDKVWFLLGFLLQTAVHGVDGGAVPKMDAKEVEAELGETCGDPGWNYMSFGRAIEEMKAGRKVARAGWNGKNQHIELATSISYMTAEGVFVNVEHEAIGNKAIAFCGTSGVQMGWLASQADMLAEDWMVVG